MRESRPAAARHRAADWALAASGAVAALLIIFDVSGPVRTVFVLGVWLLVPGWALVRHAGIADRPARLVFTVAASAVVAVAASLGMVWSSSWYPRPAAAAILLAASASLVLWPGRGSISAARAESVYRQRNRSLANGLPWLILAIAVALWAVALVLTNASRLGDWGLLPAFPVLWYVAVAAVLVSCVASVTRARTRTRYLTASVGVLVVMLYASANLVEAVPRLPWVYKHIAVTSYIGATGGVDPSIDLYNRWPGFFSLSAFLGAAIGHSDPVDYASWAEVGFALIDAVIVLAIARALTRNNAAASWTAALVFTLCNWVGQNYYSPQAFAFTLYLTLCLVVCTYLLHAPVPGMGRIERLLTQRSRRPDRRRPGHHADPADRVGGASAATAIVTISRSHRAVLYASVSVLVLQAGIVVSHQLTPYVAVLALLPLCLVGYIRPRWLGPGLLVIAVLYLLPNFDFVETHFGLFTGFNPLSNATYTPPQVQRTDAAQLQADAVILLSALVVGLGLAGFVRNVRLGNIRATLIVAWLAAAPPLILFVQAYGGEARLRIFLFALPWFSIGVGWLFWSGGKATRSSIVGLWAAITAMAVLFTVSYFQPEADNQITKAQVRAAQWLDGQIAAGDSIIEETDNFPVLIGPNYPRVLRDPGTSAVLADIQKYSSRPITTGDLMWVIGKAADAGRTYVVFSNDEDRYARRHRLFAPGVLADVEKKLAGSGESEKVYATSSVRIYRLP